MAVTADFSSSQSELCVVESLLQKDAHLFPASPLVLSSILAFVIPEWMSSFLSRSVCCAACSVQLIATVHALYPRPAL